MDRHDYYALLGVTRESSKAEIRRAFRKLARRFHPDINPGDNVAAVRYQRIYEAFEVLTDPEQRERYDQGGVRPAPESRPEPVRYGFEGFDFSLEERREFDIFPELFRRSDSDSREEVDGADIHHKLGISFEESLKGLRTSFEITRGVSCETCEGWGEIPASQPRPCTACGGRGRATQAHGFMLFARPCSKCHGSGTVARERCRDCEGAGRAARTERIELSVPPGVTDGDKIVLAGQGHQGRGRGRTGDLFVHVHVQPHPFFTRKGDNLFCTVPISFREAALGAKVEVPTLEGSVTLRVPAGVQSGQKLRLSERGAPSRRGDVRGDLFVVVQVVTPKLYDDRSRKLLEELERLNPEDPRKGMWTNPRRDLEEVSS
jgi:molecular chaperone DnaJ